MYKYKIYLIFYSIIIFTSYILGFFINENSIGSGNYNGDLIWIWKNFEIFKNHNLIDAIRNESFFGNRTPLLYILNLYLNPFLYDIDTYRFSIFIFSLLGPYSFYLCIKEKYKNVDIEIILLLSLIILLSPFYRTSAYWGMEIQYGIISALLGFYFIFKTKNIENISYSNLFFAILFSSATVYFDLKLVIVPLYVYLKILFSHTNINKKIFTTFFYFLFAVPYFLLILLWSGLVPKLTQVYNPLQVTHLTTSKIHLVNILFATNILGFYLFPFLIFKKNIFDSIKKIPNLFNSLLIIIFLAYLVYFINYDLYDYTDIITRESGGYKNFYGLGYSLKISNIIFEERLYAIILNVIIYLFSSLIILLVINNNLLNFFIILFFYLLSLFLFPLMQEYFDPYIFIIGLLILKNEYDLNLLRSSVVFLYFSIFLLSSYYYYL